MFFRVKKRLVLMLSVKIHEAGRKFLKLPYRYRCAVDLADAFAVGMKYPSYDDGIILAMVDSHIVQYFFQLLVFNGKNGFHGGLLFSPSYHFPACSASEGKAKGVYYEGFSGSCLAREDVEPLAEYDLRLVNERHVFYIHVFKHRYTPPISYVLFYKVFQ